MIVITDTGPINYLVPIGEIEVLPELYDRILTRPSICGELEHPRAPEAVRLLGRAATSRERRTDPIPTVEFLMPFPLFPAATKTAGRVAEIFTPQINNDHARRGCCSINRPKGSSSQRFVVFVTRANPEPNDIFPIQLPQPRDNQSQLAPSRCR